MIYKNEDTNLNDFLFSSEALGQRPCKIVLAFNFKSKEFLNYFEEIEIVNVLTEVIPSEGTSIVNEKYLAKVTDEIYISYTHIDKSVETSYISSVIFYYTITSSSSIEEIMMDLDGFILDQDGINKLNIVTNTQNGLVLEPLDMYESDYENIEYYYNNSTIKAYKKLVKKISKTTKGLGIIYGKRGSGKTSLLYKIASSCEKTSIFIPISMIDSTINNPEFFGILKEYNPLIIIDDCEILFDNIYTKSNATYANILQIIDGFYSDTIDTHVLLSFNTDVEDDIDSDILSANNLLKIIKVNPLKSDKANELCKFLDIKQEIEADTLLIDILNGKFEEDSIKIGYN